MKDDKKVLKEASTRFLFVRGGDAPDPRCCLVLAQPSTGRSVHTCVVSRRNRVAALGVPLDAASSCRRRAAQFAI